MTMTTDETLERLAEHRKLKWMTPSKITGEPYQMVPLDLLRELATLIRSLRDERDAAREALMPFAEFVPDFFDDGYQDGDIVKVESHHGGLDLTLTVADFRRARNIIGEA